MKSRLVAAAVSITAMLALGAPAAAQEMSTRQLKKVVKQAETADAAGRYVEAIQLYDQIRRATGIGDSRHGDALYATAMIRLSPDAAVRDVATGRRLLEQLATSFPHHSRRLEITLTRSLLAALDRATARARDGAAELEQATAALEAERRRVEVERQQQQAAGESQEAAGEVRELESRLAKAQAEVADCQAELKRSRATVKMLRDAAVGGSG